MTDSENISADDDRVTLETGTRSGPNIDDVLPPISDKRLTWLTLALGTSLLVFGWLIIYVFVAGAGFLVGRDLARAIFRDEKPNVVLLASILMGIVGAALALFAQKVAFALAGFCAGGYLALAVLHVFRVQKHAWLPFILGGLAGAVLSLTLADWAYIILSSLVGASAVSRTLVRKPMPQGIAFLVLTVIGIVVQARMMASFGGDQAMNPRDTATSVVFLTRN